MTDFITYSETTVTVTIGGQSATFPADAVKTDALAQLATNTAYELGMVTDHLKSQMKALQRFLARDLETLEAGYSVHPQHAQIAAKIEALAAKREQTSLTLTGLVRAAQQAQA